MENKLEDILIREREVVNAMSEPDTLKDAAKLQALMKEQATLAPVADAYRKYKKCVQDIEENKALLTEESDPEMREMIEEDIRGESERRDGLMREIRILLIPRDPNDTRNAIVEIRAGAGGDEAALFASDLYRMYVKYADAKHWKCDMISVNENGIGGFKECTFQISGKDVWSHLKYESGTHRVQRIPETESGGRIHTSTATVAIMPEAEEVDVEIDPKDIRIDVFRASGNGGQCVNTTDSAVRLTHIPTGIVISCQDEKSQLKNRAKALKVLRSKLYDLERRRLSEERASMRKSQVGTGDRSEKIRTYNFPQGRVTDHRIHLTLHRIEQVMDGDLDEIIDSLTAAEQAEKLSNLS